MDDPESGSDTDDNDPDPACQITDVTANESISTGLDWVTAGPLTLTLNADRGGLGTGRIYTVTVMCTNNAGLSSTGSASTPSDCLPVFERVVLLDACEAGS